MQTFPIVMLWHQSLYFLTERVRARTKQIRNCLNHFKPPVSKHLRSHCQNHLETSSLFFCFSSKRCFCRRFPPHQKLLLIDRLSVVTENKTVQSKTNKTNKTSFFVVIFTFGMFIQFRPAFVNCTSRFIVNIYAQFPIPRSKKETSILKLFRRKLERASVFFIRFQKQNE